MLQKCTQLRSTTPDQSHVFANTAAYTANTLLLGLLRRIATHLFSVFATTNPVSQLASKYTRKSGSKVVKGKCTSLHLCVPDGILPVLSKSEAAADLLRQAFDGHPMPAVQPGPHRSSDAQSGIQA